MNANFLEVVKRYMLADDVDAALCELQSFVDLGKLAELLAWLDQRYGEYRLKGFAMIKDAESGQPLTLAILFEDCGKNEWSKVAENAKNYLNTHGLKEVAGKVSIVCLKALKEMGIEIEEK